MNEGRAHSPTYHTSGPGLIRIDQDSCRECWTCARLCPAKAIRIVDGKAGILEERCVSCGLCVMECSGGCYQIRDDIDQVKRLLAGPRPVVGVLATEFVTACHPMNPTEVERRLEAMGFHAIESTLLGEELVATRYEELCAQRNGTPVLRSTCPVVVEWVRKYHPSLVGALAPVVPPYVAQARLVKELYAGDVAVVYVSPCFARKDEALSGSFAGAVDAAIDFTEMRRLVEESGNEVRGTGGSNRPAPLKEISLTDGFPRKPLEQRTMTATDVLVSRGIRDVGRVLGAIEDGDTDPDIVDLLSCEGCIDGPAVAPGMSVFAKRNIDIAEREGRPSSAVSNRELLGYLPQLDLDRAIEAAPVVVKEPTESEIDTALAAGGFASREDVLDCGACGYRTCVGLARAIIQEVTTWEMCFPLQRRKLNADIAHLSTSATIDPVTGLGNRTALSARLEDEVSRHVRYGQPVSLLMLDLDTFKAVNDEWGHLVGDQLLTSVGHLLSEGMRTSDYAARYGGDEFAVILASTGKTEAYAVAEKIRAAIASLKVVPRGQDEGFTVGTTVSIGVASAGEALADAHSLMEAADRAMYVAKEAGRDQVRLSAQ